MKIGGFQPLTLTDYPGRVAAIVFTQGCNFRCPFCHNASLLTPAEVMDERQVLKILKDRRARLDAVVISGGEPTLQLDVTAFAEDLKKQGFQVKLDTNGSRPGVLRELLDRSLLDCVAMDIKAPFRKYDRLAGVPAPTDDIRKSVALLLGSDIVCEFRTTFVPTLLTQEDLDEIRSYLPERARYTVQPFIAGNALDESLRKAASHPLRDIMTPTPGPAKCPAPSIG